jgi:hypothetical protein
LVEVISFTPRPLYYQGKSPRYPLDKRLDGAQARSGRRGEDKNILPLSVAMLTELPWIGEEKFEQGKGKK